MCRVPHSFAFFADEGVRLDSTASEVFRCAALDFRFPLLEVYPYRSSLPEAICAEATPFPLVGPLHQPPFYRISMHVPQLLNSFVFGPYTKIVKTFLPHGGGGFFQSCPCVAAVLRHFSLSWRANRCLTTFITTGIALFRFR